MTRDKFMTEIHLKQLEFSDGTSGPFTKSNERVKKLKELVIVKTCIGQNMLSSNYSSETTKKSLKKGRHR